MGVLIKGRFYPYIETTPWYVKGSISDHTFKLHMLCIIFIRFWQVAVSLFKYVICTTGDHSSFTSMFCLDSMNKKMLPNYCWLWYYLFIILLPLSFITHNTDQLAAANFACGRPTMINCCWYFPLWLTHALEVYEHNFFHFEFGSLYIGVFLVPNSCS